MLAVEALAERVEGAGPDVPIDDAEGAEGENGKAGLLRLRPVGSVLVRHGEGTLSQD
jgi:hypothetical protein